MVWAVYTERLQSVSLSPENDCNPLQTQINLDYYQKQALHHPLHLKPILPCDLQHSALTPLELRTMQVRLNLFTHHFHSKGPERGGVRRVGRDWGSASICWLRCHDWDRVSKRMSRQKTRHNRGRSVAHKANIFSLTAKHLSVSFRAKICLLKLFFRGD